MNGEELKPNDEIVDRIFPLENVSSKETCYSEIPLHQSGWQLGKKCYDIISLNVGDSVLYLARGGREIRERPDTFVADAWINR
jgi:hypothetical protein